MTLTSLTQLSALLVALTCAGPPVPQDLPPPAVVDLGHPLSDADPTWSGRPVFKHTTSTENGIFVGSFETDEHFGTHVDAPAHFVPGGWTVNQIPVIRLVRPAVRIDLRAKVAKNEDYRMTREDVLAFERKNGAIAPGTIVLILTGWDARWTDPARYRNEHDGALHFPGLSAEAAQVLDPARHRRPSASTRPAWTTGRRPRTKSTTRRCRTTSTHRERRQPRVAARAGFTVVVAPVNVKGGSGAPARVFAVFRP